MALLLMLLVGKYYSFDYSLIICTNDLSNKQFTAVVLVLSKLLTLGNVIPLNLSSLQVVVILAVWLILSVLLTSLVKGCHQVSLKIYNKCYNIHRLSS